MIRIARRMEPRPSGLPIVDVNLKSVEKRDSTWFFHFTDNVSSSPSSSGAYETADG